MVLYHINDIILISKKTICVFIFLILSRKGENVMKKQNKSSIVWFILSVIAMIFLTMRVAMNWELKGAVLVFFILGIVIEIIWIAKNIIKFFREYE